MLRYVLHNVMLHYGYVTSYITLCYITVTLRLFYVKFRYVTFTNVPSQQMIRDYCQYFLDPSGRTTKWKNVFSATLLVGLIGKKLGRITIATMVKGNLQNVTAFCRFKREFIETGEQYRYFKMIRISNRNYLLISISWVMKNINLII